MPKFYRSITVAFFLVASLAAEAGPTYGREEEFLRCEKLLVEGRYCLPDQAEIVCSMVSLSVAGCAMDLMDMKQFSDIFDALEYCRAHTR
jgi:hypothetical protein